jgi:hypothetical protein
VGPESARFYNGLHSLVTSDTNGCFSEKYFLVTSPDKVKGQVSALSRASCFEARDASAEIYPSGGVGGFNILWSHGGTSLRIDSIYAGVYGYVLTDSNNCEFIDTVLVGQPEELRSKIAVFDSIQCKGDYNGRLVFNVMGGTKPYFYKPLESNLWIQDTKIIQMPEGFYTYQFTDARNCVGADTLVVDMVSPDSLIFDELNLRHTTCNEDNGSIGFTMKGGTPPYNYEWTDRYREVISTGTYIENLKRQTQYWLKVVDAHDCTFKFEKQIQTSYNPSIEQIDITDVLCYGDSTGRAEVMEVIPGVPYAPYQIYWSIGDTGSVNSNHFAGTHYAFVVDDNGCASERYFDVRQPDSLYARLLDSANAQCYNYNNGYINTYPVGGVGGYQMHWSNGTTEYNNSNLPKGIYSLALTDANQCLFEQTYIITEPDSVMVKLDNDIAICPGNTYTLDGSEFAGHNWTLNGAPYSSERFVHLTQSGLYHLLVTDNKGCHGSDEFILDVGNNALKAEFYMTSEANLGDTLNIIELSNLPLDSLRWTYNEDVFFNYTLLTDPAYLLRLKSYETGIYNVKLTAYTGGCISTQVKQVEIIEMFDSSGNFNYLGYNPLIESMVIAPNPSDGEFVAKIALREVADIKLVVYGVDKGNIIDMRENYGLDSYEIPYNLRGNQSGVYIIIVTASNERKQSKLIFK